VLNHESASSVLELHLRVNNNPIFNELFVYLRIYFIKLLFQLFIGHEVLGWNGFLSF